SLVVSPANSLPLYAKQNGAKLIEINPEKTPMSSEMNLSLRATSVESLPRLVDLVSFC
ncbi:MAG: NAD-dependent protein deacylase, partial [Candidatus Nitrosotenuis sp.]